MITGVVISFDNRNGFGFIRSRAFPQDVLVHACSVVGGRMLRAGQRVAFEAEPSAKGPRAVHVKPRRAPFRLVVKRVTPEALVALLCGVALLALTLAGRMLAGWSWLLAWLAAANAVTLVAFALDKRRAILGRRRLSEILLLSLAAVGGSVAAVLAVPALRHKTQKGVFKLILGLIVLAQAAAAAAFWWATHRP
jgi:uncharacterized membrane protein YsdA (DUF1294 family)/cold shock CspA family protein